MSGTSDLIIRQAVIDLWERYHPYIAVKANEFDRELRKLPSAQPERKPGKWLIREFGDDAQCSECGMYFKDAYDSENSDHYCRHCGAEMEGTALRLNG